jgi:DNA-binding transcriptional MerR regulator
VAQYKLTQAAKLVGVASITLKRWLLERKIPEVQRDRNGWRVFTDLDIERIKNYAERLHPPPTGSNGQAALFTRRS